MSIVVCLIICAVNSLIVNAVSIRYVQMLQLSGYRIRGVIGWLKRTNGDYLTRTFALVFFSVATMLIFVVCFSQSALKYIGALFYLILSVYFIVLQRRQKKKTPLKFTARVCRLLPLVTVLNFGLSLLSVYFVKDTIVCYSLIGVVPLFSLLSVIVSALIASPIEALISAFYESKAKKKIAGVSVIGITGSYGKTTAKNILEKFLSVKYSVYASPHSYNTPMGLCKCVNEEYAKQEFFIAEMGARYKGDIKKLKKIFKPEYTMLTSIGDQHLETFGSLKNIIEEKCSITEGTQFSVANGYDELVKNNVKNAVITGENIKFDNVVTNLSGTAFTLTVGEESVEVVTRLLGDHIPELITLCAAFAMHFGITLSDIAEQCEKLPYVEHRLEVLNGGNMIILDDSFNSNPNGAKNALKILDSFEGTKVIVTPGFVELGKDSEAKLVEFGKQIMDVCNYAFLVGRNADVIKKGATYDRALKVSSLDEAMSLLGEIVPPYAVLFENDLPDNY